MVRSKFALDSDQVQNTSTGKCYVSLLHSFKARIERTSWLRFGRKERMIDDIGSFPQLDDLPRFFD